MIRQRLIDERIIKPEDLVAAPHATPEMIGLAHDPDYVRSIIDGTISPSAMRRIGFPWSGETWRRAAATVGGALSAARTALEDGVSGQIAGGTHHAHYDFGAGYCIFNDLAIVAATLLNEGLVRRVAIVDLDVHQGDGTASILAGRDDVFTFSVHGAKNFPFRKSRSSLDVELADGVGDDEYRRTLAEHLPAVWDFRPDLILYQAGVDLLAEDRLGRMALTLEGLMRRDRLVIEGARARKIPVSIALGGGYADPIEKSVEAYANTWKIACAL